MTTSTGHPGEMVHWPEIRCQRGHLSHKRRIVEVDLFREHGYHDYPQVPDRLAVHFPMYVWSWNDEDLDGEGYCPAVDAVSQTIEQLGIWEPAETIITLAAMTAADPDSIFLDFGAQIGWFSMLAAASGHDVVAFEADPDCMDLIKKNAALDGRDDQFSYREERVGPDTPPLTALPGSARRIALAKIDVEGAEEHAVDCLAYAIEAGLVDHLLIEISPVFNDSYPDLVVWLLEAGYEAWSLPNKRTPPPRFENFPDDLYLSYPGLLMGAHRDYDAVRENVASWHQRNVLFSRPGAPL